MGILNYQEVSIILLNTSVREKPENFCRDNIVFERVPPFNLTDIYGMNGVSEDGVKM